jgi:hypothetical protein
MASTNKNASHLPNALRRQGAKGSTLRVTSSSSSSSSSPSSSSPSSSSDNENDGSQRTSNKIVQTLPKYKIPKLVDVDARLTIREIKREKERNILKKDRVNERIDKKKQDKKDDGDALDRKEKKIICSITDVLSSRGKVPVLPAKIHLTYTCPNTAAIVSSLHHCKQKVLSLLSSVDETMVNLRRRGRGRSAVRTEIELKLRKKQTSAILDQMSGLTRKIENEPVSLGQMEILVDQLMEYVNDSYYRVRAIKRCFLKDR